MNFDGDFTSKKLEFSEQQEESVPDKKYYGKYRGKVRKNKDPKGMGRILAYVAAVPESKKNWAVPCVPYAGPGVGFLAIPPIRANVWIEYEGGNPNRPIWTGGFWASRKEMPREAKSPDIKVFKTKHTTMVFNDREKNKGGFSLTCTPQAVKTKISMTFNSRGITLKCPKSTAALTKDSISLTVPKAKIFIKSNAMKLAVPKSQLDITSQKIHAKSATAKLTMTSRGIDVKGTKINAKASTTFTAKSRSFSANAAKVNIKANTKITAKALKVGITGMVKMN